MQPNELYYAGPKLQTPTPTPPPAPGSHGFDIAGPRKQHDSDDGQQQEHISYSAADSYRPALESAKAKVLPMHLAHAPPPCLAHICPHLAPSRVHLAHQVEEVLGDVKGVVVEDNTFSVSVHYRMVAEGEDRERVNEEVDRLVADMPMLRKTYGKMVYELRPSVDWHKGKAVEWLMEQFSKNSSEVRGRDRGRGRARIYVQREDLLTL